MRVWKGPVAAGLVELGGPEDMCIAGDTAAQEGGAFAFPGLREPQGFGPSHAANKWLFPYKEFVAPSVLVPLHWAFQTLGVVRLARCFSEHSLMLEGLALTATEEGPKTHVTQPTRWEAPRRLLKRRHTQVLPLCFVSH